MQETQETPVQSLGWEDLLENEMVTHSSILAWLNSMDREAWQATVHGVTKSWTRLRNWARTHIIITNDGAHWKAVAFHPSTRISLMKDRPWGSTQLANFMHWSTGCQAVQQWVPWPAASPICTVLVSWATANGSAVWSAQGSNNSALSIVGHLGVKNSNHFLPHRYSRHKSRSHMPPGILQYSPSPHQEAPSSLQSSRCYR